MSKIPEPCDAMSCSDHSGELVSPLTLTTHTSRGQREIPSARVFCAPGIFSAVGFHPPMSSRRPSILMSKHALLSLAPQHREIHDTAAMLSPLISIGSPAASGLSPTNSSMTHAVTTILSNSNRLIVMMHVSPNAFLLRSVVSSSGKSYLQKSSSQRRNRPPRQNWRRISSVIWRVVLSPCSRERLEPLTLAVGRGRSPISKRGGRRETLYQVPPYNSGCCYLTSRATP